jgi:hypothetical protein
LVFAIGTALAALAALAVAGVAELKVTQVKETIDGYL